MISRLLQQKTKFHDLDSSKRIDSYVVKFQCLYLCSRFTFFLVPHYFHFSQATDKISVSEFLAVFARH